MALMAMAIGFELDFLKNWRHHVTQNSIVPVRHAGVNVMQALEMCGASVHMEGSSESQTTPMGGLKAPSRFSSGKPLASGLPSEREKNCLL